MTVVDGRLKDNKKFGILSMGDIFSCKGGYEYYIVIGNSIKAAYNAVNLLTGELCKFDDTDTVEKLDDVTLMVMR